MKFELKVYHRNVPSEKLIADLKRVSNHLGKNILTIEEYRTNGKYSWDIYRNRYGSWRNALKAAGLKAGKARVHVEEPELFNNLRLMWEQLGRQPKAKEVKKPFSKYACNTYLRRFGTWQNALKAFVEYIYSEVEETRDQPEEKPSSPPVRKTETIYHRTSRKISERLRFRILLRDGFACTACGRSPLNTRGVELHVDHIIPWSKGGENEPENLSTKCVQCNLGKGNLLETDG